MSASRSRSAFVATVTVAEHDVSVLKILIVAEFDPLVEINLVSKAQPAVVAAAASNDAPPRPPVVPQIRTERGILKGSNTLARHFAHNVPASAGHRLLGNDSWERAKVDEWMEAVASPLEHTVATNVLPRILQPDEFKDEFRAAADPGAAQKLPEPAFAGAIYSALADLNAHLKTRTYLVGDQVTLADISIVASLSHLFKFFLGEDRQQEFPYVTRYFIACASTREFRAVLGPVALCRESLWTVLSKRPNVDEQLKIMEESGFGEPPPEPLRFEEMPLPADAPLVIPALDNDEGLDALEKHLAQRNFVFNHTLTKADVALRRRVQAVLLQCPSNSPGGNTASVARAFPDRARHPSVLRWFRHVGRITDGLSRLALQRLPAAEPAELIVVEQEAERETVMVKACEHPRLRDFFAQLQRRAPRSHVQGRLLAQEKKMRRPFAAAVLDTPDKMVPNDFEPMPYDGSDIFAPKPLAMLTSSEVLAVLRNAHRKVLAEGDFISELDLTCFLAPFRARKKGTKITGRRLGQLAREDLLAMPGCALLEDEADMLLAVVETLKGTGVEPVLLVKPKVEAEDLEELPPLEDGSTGPGWLQKHHVLGSTDPAGRQTHSCGDKDAGSTEGSDDAALQIAPVLSVSYRPRRSDKVTTVMRWLDGVQPSPDGSLQMLLRWMDESGISGDDTLIAFDFDFTLKGAPNPLTQESEVRDKEHTLAALRELQRRNANMIIVTARQAHHTAWEGVRHRVHSLGLHEFIGKAKRLTSDQMRQLRNLFSTMYNAEQAALKQGKKGKKGASKGRAASSAAGSLEAVRPGADKVVSAGRVAHEIAEAFAREIGGTGEEAQQKVSQMLIDIVAEDAIAATVAMAGSSDAPKSIAAPIESTTENSAPKVGVSFDEMVQLVLRIVKPVQMEPPKRETDGTTDVNGNYVPPLYPKIKSETGKYEWNCWRALDTNGNDMVCGEGLVMSRYNKAECIHAYTAAYGLQPKHIIFVDDFCQNAFNVAWYFGSDRASQNNQGLPPPASLERVTAVWWDPTAEMKAQEKMIKEFKASTFGATDTPKAPSTESTDGTAVVMASGAAAAASTGSGGGRKEKENLVASEDSNDPKYAQCIRQIKHGEFSPTNFYPYTYG